MKKILLLLLSISLIVFACEKSDVTPEPQKQVVTPSNVTVNPQDTLVKFTLYSKRVPYIWKRVVNKIWVQDTIKTNDAIRFEPFDKRNYGTGYWVTMNLKGLPTDSLHIIGEYKGRLTQMSSLKKQSAAYVLIDNIK